LKDDAKFVGFNSPQLAAIEKITHSFMKSMPYQTLIRHWLAEEIRKELDMVKR
jgi:hypothetical protein